MATKRQITIQPYQPDDTENLGNNTKQFSDKDIGKSVKYNGDQMDPCADGDEIAGFVQSVNMATSDGHSVGGVRTDGRAEALDEAGTLAVDDFVVAGTAGVLGTFALANVKIAAGTPLRYKWVVIAVIGAGAGRTVRLKRI